MKKTVKIVNIVLVVMMALLLLTTTVKAADGILQGVKPNYSQDGSTQITNMGQKIISYISIIGVVISVLVLTILGIKYMIGSASEKAEYKKTMIPYLVGAVLVFGASAIAGVVVNVTTDLTNG